VTRATVQLIPDREFPTQRAQADVRKRPRSPYWSLLPSPHCKHPRGARCHLKRARSCWP